MVNNPVPQGDDEGLLTRAEFVKHIADNNLGWRVEYQVSGLAVTAIAKAQRDLTRQEKANELTLAKAEAEGYASEMLSLQQDCIQLRQELPKLVAEKEQAIIAHYRQERLDRSEIPDILTNNIGCMSKAEIENFATMVLKECDYPYTMKWTTAGDIMIEPFIYIDERHIDEYPYMAKERVLHEIAHIDTHPQDDRHGELFHSRLAELIEQFMGRSSYRG